MLPNLRAEIWAFTRKMHCPLLMSVLVKSGGQASEIQQFKSRTRDPDLSNGRSNSHAVPSLNCKQSIRDVVRVKLSPSLLVANVSEKGRGMPCRVESEI